MASTKTPLELAALATAAIPGLKVTELRDPQYDDEFASVSGVVDAEGNSWTVVASKEEFSSSEVNLLSHLLALLDSARVGGALPFSVPQLRGAVATDPGTYTFVYSDTGGRPLQEAQVLADGLLAASLGRSLAGLHNLQVLDFAESGCPVLPAEATRKALKKTLLAMGGDVPAGLKRRWRVALDEDVLWSYQPTLIHGDLGLANVLADGGAVISLTGFKYLRVDDPAIDLAWLLSIADGAFLQRFQETYSAHRRVPDLHLLTRAQLHSEMALLQWLQFGRETGDAQIVADAQAMLADLDADLDGALLVRSSEPVAEIHFDATEEPLMQLSASEGELPPSDAPGRAAAGSVGTGSAGVMPAAETPGATDPDAVTEALETELDWEGPSDQEQGEGEPGRAPLSDSPELPEGQDDLDTVTFTP